MNQKVVSNLKDAVNVLKGHSKSLGKIAESQMLLLIETKATKEDFLAFTEDVRSVNASYV
jgi:hypothetical protein